MQVKVISCAVAATVHIRVGSRCNRQAVEIAMLGSDPMAARAGVEGMAIHDDIACTRRT